MGKSLLGTFVLPYLIMICFPLNSPADEGFLQRFEIPSSPNPVGSGAGSVGMGGAFISIADDATAASWNPAGLTQLHKPEISITGAMVHRREKNKFGSNPEADGTQTITGSDLNYLSLAYPFKLRDKYAMAVSLAYQNLYDFKRQWDYGITDPDNSSLMHYDLDGSLSAFGISYCIDIRPRFSFGITLNLWEDGIYRNEWEERRVETRVYNDGDIFENRTLNRYSFSGVNATVGFMWHLWTKGNKKNKKWIRLGAVLKTPFEADLGWEYEYSSRSADGKSNFSAEGKQDETLNMPLSYGIGISCRFSHNWTAALDIYRTEWEDYTLTDTQGNETSPITGEPAGKSAVDPTHQVRLGLEYFFVNDPDAKRHITLSGGLFYDPAPAVGSPDDFFGFSLGGGFGFQRMKMDIAYQFRFGNDVGDSILQNRRFSQDAREHRIYSSVIYYY